MIKRIKNIKNGSMKEIYENLANKEQYIKIFTKFFGEENRDRIEQLINNAVIVLYPKKIEHFKFSQFLACNYPELSGIDVDYLYEYFSKVPQLIYEKNWGELFVDYVINQFGFNS